MYNSWLFEWCAALFMGTLKYCKYIHLVVSTKTYPYFERRSTTTTAISVCSTLVFCYCYQIQGPRYTPFLTNHWTECQISRIHTTPTLMMTCYDGKGCGVIKVPASPWSGCEAHGVRPSGYRPFVEAAPSPHKLIYADNGAPQNSYHVRWYSYEFENRHSIAWSPPFKQLAPKAKTMSLFIDHRILDDRAISYH